MGFNGEELLFNKQQQNRRNNIYFISGFSHQQLMCQIRRVFLEAYRAKYNEEPSTSLQLCIHSVYLCSNAAKGAKLSVDIKNNLAKHKTEAGHCQTSFDADHNTVKTAFMTLMNNGKAEAAHEKR